MSSTGTFTGIYRGQAGSVRRLDRRERGRVRLSTLVGRWLGGGQDELQVSQKKFISRTVHWEIAGPRVRMLLNLSISSISSRARRCPLAIILHDHEGLSLAISCLLTQCFEHCHILQAHHWPCNHQLLCEARFALSAAHLAVLPLAGGRRRCCAWCVLACSQRWCGGGK